MNSFRFVERAIELEAQRQIDVLEEGGRIAQETLLYDAGLNQTRPMRSKEEANDYRYFPDPDLLPVVIDEELVDRLRDRLPELPDEKRRRFVAAYDLPEYDASVLTAHRPFADYFENVARATQAKPKLAANWVIGDVAAALNREGIDIEASRISAEALAALLDKIADGTISGKIAKDVFDAVWKGEGDVDTIIKERGLEQITDSASIAALVDEVIAANPEQAQQYRDGNAKVLGYLVGQVMKASRGKANPQQVNAALREKLGG